MTCYVTVTVESVVQDRNDGKPVRDVQFAVTIVSFQRRMSLMVTWEFSLRAHVFENSEECWVPAGERANTTSALSRLCLNFSRYLIRKNVCLCYWGHTWGISAIWLFTHTHKDECTLVFECPKPQVKACVSELKSLTADWRPTCYCLCKWSRDMSLIYLLYCKVSLMFRCGCAQFLFWGPQTHLYICFFAFFKAVFSPLCSIWSVE